MVKKYVIEIEQQYGACTSKETHMTVPPMHLYKVKGFDSLVFDEKGLDKLTPLDCYCDEECGIADAESNGYDCGLTDAWDAVTWLWYNETIRFDAWDAKEMMEYYRARLKESEYQVGDIITDGSKNYLIVDIDENSYVAVQGTDFEPVSIGKDYIGQYKNLHDRKDMRKVIESLTQ